MLQCSSSGTALRHISHAERCQHTKYGIKPCQNRTSQTIFQICQRPNCPFFCFRTIPHRQYIFSIGQHHAQKRRHPHPKNCPCSASGNGCCNTDNVSRSHSSCQRCGTRFPLFCTVFPTEQSAERLSENRTDSKNLKKMRANTEKQSCSQQQDQQSTAPNPCIQLFQHKAVLRIFIKSTDLS